MNNITSERQVPSKGLNITEMSYALRDFGFGTRVYSNGTYGIKFEKLLSCYAESGIPIIIGIDNRLPIVFVYMLSVQSLSMYKQDIGRWFAPDPYGHFNSPYIGMANNPVSAIG